MHNNEYRWGLSWNDTARGRGMRKKESEGDRERGEGER